MNRATFLKEVNRAAMAVGASVAFAGRDQLHIRKGDVLKQFKVDYRRLESLNRVVTDPILQEK